MTESPEPTATVQRPYPEKFKREAVELLRTSGQPLAQVARELGVSPESLRLWRKQAEVDADEREGLSSEEREEPRRPRHGNHLVKRTPIWAWAIVVVLGVVVSLPLLSLAGYLDGGSDDPDDNKVATPLEAGNPLDGSFVGKVSGTNAVVAVVAKAEQDPGEAEVYLADGKRVSKWFSGSISDDSFLAKSNDGEAEAEGKLSGGSVKGTVELPNGKTVRYKASRPTGAAGLYDLTVSARGKLSGTSAAGLGVAGGINLLEGTGVLRLADGRRLGFEIVEDTGDDLVRVRPGQVRLIVLPSGQLAGVGKSRSAAGGGERAFFIFG